MAEFSRSPTRFAAFAGALLLAATTHAGTLFGVVTERAAPVAAEAARLHLLNYPGDRIVLRTPGQLLAAPERQVARWLADADALLAVAAFGDGARRLGELAPRHARKARRVLAFNGEQGLTALSRYGAGTMADFPVETSRQLAAETPPEAALDAARAHPVARRWLAARQTWQAGGAGNVARVFEHLLRAELRDLPAPQPDAALRVRVGEREWSGAAAWNNAELRAALPAEQVLVVLDLSTSDPRPAEALCAEARRRRLVCAAIFARWGATSREVVERLPELIAPAKPAALVVLQDFVIGAAEGREAATAALNKLNVPVFKAIRLTDRSATQWRLSPDGLPADSVQYRVALPELQGSGQPIVIAAAGRPQSDARTGIEIKRPEILAAEVARLVSRAVRWQRLSAKANRDKRVAVVYYNHPPGRQNIGADNLDVPASLFDTLHALRDAGYDLGDPDKLPASPAALLEMIMARGVNLPEDRQALRELALDVNGVGLRDYARWFARLPARVRGEMSEGPLGRLHAEVVEAEAAGERALGRRKAESALKELHHLVSGADHPQRLEAMRLLDRLAAGYAACLAENTRQRTQPRSGQPCGKLAATKDRLGALKIEGLRGWGAPPGRVMVEGERLLVPGLTFGKVFIGPQPPRGWEVDEELLHANTSITPPHQYLAFYHWLRDSFPADAVVHFGRHSTYEFLPGKAVGLTADDYPSLVASDLPGIYPYIVDGVGEGIQAKRRGLAVMVDHLTPPIATTPLYDQLLTLRQVVESFESAASDSLRTQAARSMREQVDALQLRAELEASMADVLQVRGIGIDQADDDLLAHEVGHYLTKLQEKFMPYGLHIFGRPWSQANLDLMLGSMRGGADRPALAASVVDNLTRSPRLEMAGLLGALDGGFVAPGKGNDPLRSPEALPTGRNFHAVDGDLLPTRLGYGLGSDLAAKALNKAKNGSGSEAVILWASDAVRDEGVMVAFSLALMRAEPVWNARGIVTDVRLLPAAATSPRRDVLVTTSGLFRDLYPNLLNLIDRAGRLALAASAATLAEADPGLQEALAAALAPVANASSAQWGNEPLAANRLAERWQARAKALLAQGKPPAEAGREAAWRIFGDAPGAYGAGVNRLTERSGAWRERGEIGRSYLNRLGHSYALDSGGEAAHAAFDNALRDVTRAYHGRASHLYGLLDNNDAFDYLGGLSLAVETLAGHRPDSLILQHAEAGQASVEPLTAALLGELRGRYLNPAWIKPLMAHDYAGARTMGQEFLENLWGWQVTRPDLVQSWAWDEVKRVYFDDGHRLGLPKFLAEGANAHVKAHMLAIMMVAAQKGFWQTDAATIRRLGGELARLTAKNGLPGSGHTAPKHPMWAWLAPQLDSAEAAALGVTLARARGENVAAAHPGAPLRAASPAPVPASSQAAPAAQAPVAEARAPAARYYELTAAQTAPATLPAGFAPLLAFLFLAGLALGRRDSATPIFRRNR